jgi:hypothetical protein
MMLRWAALLMALVVACTPRRVPGEQEQLGVAHLPFDSAESVLLDLSFDGRVMSDVDGAAARDRIVAQLMFTVGLLNGERAVGRFERLELSSINVTPSDAGAGYVVTYRAKLPVAWGSASVPEEVSLVLPARMAEPDQLAFADKYGSRCADPAAGVVHPGALFLHWRPQREGCVIDPIDAVTLRADVSRSSETSVGKFPEYHRIWADGALDVVAIFSREHPASSGEAVDEGIDGFRDFIAETDALLRARQPDEAKHAVESSPGRVRREATLPDGRTIRIHVALVDVRLADEESWFDAWYGALTPNADMILYSGHAGLGENVRTLARKGTFAAEKYLVFMVNGCDTLAYLDHSLADRRARLNPSDPTGTRFMDTISNAMPGYFRSTNETAMAFVRAAIASRDRDATPKTYRQILGELDPEQVSVVTGEEDNTFDPAMFRITETNLCKPGECAGHTPGRPYMAKSEEPSPPGPPAAHCAATARPTSTWSPMLSASLLILALRQRRAKRSISAAIASGASSIGK